MLFTAGASLVAGLLTVLAPCVLPLLPVILGGSMVREERDRWRPFIIAGSLVASLILFTLLLKASTVLIGVDRRPRDFTGKTPTSQAFQTPMGSEFSCEVANRVRPW